MDNIYATPKGVINSSMELIASKVTIFSEMWSEHLKAQMLLTIAFMFKYKGHFDEGLTALIS